jgi:surface antigen
MEPIMSSKYLIAATLAALVLGACESNPSKQDIGMVSGAVVGGVIGHQVGHGAGNAIATIGGAALGGFIGSRIGRSMDRDDQRKAAQALETSPDERASAWRNPNTGQTYSVTPKRTYAGADGPCRDFETSTEIEGKKETVRGTACRQADGSWKTG